MTKRVHVLRNLLTVIFCLHVKMIMVLAFTQRELYCDFRRATLLASREKMSEDPDWPCRALLFSSFSDGIVDNKEALSFFRSSLFFAMLHHEVDRLESEVESSALFSPCNGPDPTAVASLEEIDDALSKLKSNCLDEEYIQQNTKTSNLKVLYIPTAMYALRSESNNSPGKQRQRARAAAKKRRSQILRLVQSLIGDGISISSVILDLDDGSIKQAEGSDSFQAFPTNGVEALQKWKPHLIYIEGGNTFWLHHCIEKGEWKPLLLDSIKGSSAAIYMGESAGAILAGASIDTATWKAWDDPSIVPGKEKYDNWSMDTGLNLIGGSSVFPHMSKEWEELICSKKESHDYPIYCIHDSDVMLCDGLRKCISIVSKT